MQTDESSESDEGGHTRDQTLRRSDPCIFFATSKTELRLAPNIQTQYTAAIMPHKHKRRADDDDENQYVYQHTLTTSNARY